MSMPLCPLVEKRDDVALPEATGPRSRDRPALVWLHHAESSCSISSALEISRIASFYTLENKKHRVCVLENTWNAKRNRKQNEMKNNTPEIKLEK